MFVSIRGDEVMNNSREWLNERNVDIKTVLLSNIETAIIDL